MEDLTISVTDGDWFADESSYGSPYIEDGSGGIIAEVYFRNDAYLFAQAKELYSHIYQDIDILERDAKKFDCESGQFARIKSRIEEKKKLLRSCKQSEVSNG